MAKQLCLSCSNKPATRKDGTVPLCDRCYKLAQENKRGVKVVGKPRQRLSGVQRV